MVFQGRTPYALYMFEEVCPDLVGNMISGVSLRMSVKAGQSSLGSQPEKASDDLHAVHPVYRDDVSLFHGVLVRVDGITVKAVDATVGTDPDIAQRILYDTGCIVVQQSVCSCEMMERKTVLGFSGKAGAQKKHERQ